MPSCEYMMAPFDCILSSLCWPLGMAVGVEEVVPLYGLYVGRAKLQAGETRVFAGRNIKSGATRPSGHIGTSSTALVPSAGIIKLTLLRQSH